MVYCGKASRGCTHCRTRRIKCDRAEPECSQCIRASKTCPGYRDQLSLMFRDESSKVIQKAHAQWGISTPSASSSAATPTTGRLSPQDSTDGSIASSSASYSFVSPSDLTMFTYNLTSEPSTALPDNDPSHPRRFAGTKNQTAVVPISPSVPPNLDEKGIQFYLSQYVLGHPGEPRSAAELSNAGWALHPGLQDIMAAIGLGALANLSGSADTMIVARRRYVSALSQTATLIKTQIRNRLDMYVAMKAVVLLALFEIVKDCHRSTSVSIHVMGAAALMRNFLLQPDTPVAGFKGLLQLCYSMLIPSYTARSPLPAEFSEWVSSSHQLMEPEDLPSTTLATLCAQFVQISAFIHAHKLTDGRPVVHNILKSLLVVDAQLSKWEHSVDGKWLIRTEESLLHPPQALFRGRYHIYFDMWTARVWNYYRWARILVNHQALDLAAAYPATGDALLPEPQRSRCLETIRRMAEDTLLSVPCHWRHPLLANASVVTIDHHSPGNNGAAGVPVLLCQIMFATCAPGVPRDYWLWALGVVECVWADMGMHQARSVMDSMRAYRSATEVEGDPT